MPRQHPRFLYSHVTSGKSQGHFVVHLLEPQCLFLLNFSGNLFTLEVINDFGKGFDSGKNVSPAEQERRITKDAHAFVESQILAGNIGK